MISSIPNFFCCITNPCRNKVELKNESNYVVKYEAYIYRGATISKIDAAIGAGGFNGKTALEIIQSEKIQPEVRCIPKNSSVHVTCSYGGKIAIRYFMVGLHLDYTDELANFEVLDLVTFPQPDQDDINSVIFNNKEIKKVKKREERERKAKEEQEEQEKIERKAIEKKCSSLSKGMCSDMSNTPKKQCPRCDDWYCNHHHAINSKGVWGGHICKT
jgi:hypothetical protein|tara:strand:+ start:40 stop:687 length:648 start_codon:yes stop_codon:yes gene_type:complete